MHALSDRLAASAAHLPAAIVNPCWHRCRSAKRIGYVHRMGHTPVPNTLRKDRPPAPAQQLPGRPINDPGWHIPPTIRNEPPEGICGSLDRTGTSWDVAPIAALSGCARKQGPLSITSPGDGLPQTDTEINQTRDLKFEPALCGALQAPELKVVEPRGIEPLTSAVRLQRSPI